MNGELAQRIALVTYANKVLASDVDAGIDRNSTLQYVRSIGFTFTTRKLLSRSVVTASSASEWFEQLARRGARRLELVCLVGPPGAYMDAAHAAEFGGGVNGPILVQCDRSTERWNAAWSVADGDRPADNRIWNVRYSGETLRSPVTPSHPAVHDASQQLAETLAVVEAFARSNDLEHWADMFGDAQRLLTAASPEIPYHLDLLPPDAAIDVRRLAGGAVGAYVFSGMGSWNDMGFDDVAVQGRYEQLTQQLFQSVMFALDAVANAA